MKFTLYFDGNLIEGVKALLPSDSKILVESKRSLIVESSVTWKVMEKIFNDIAVVGKCQQKDPSLNSR